MLIVLTDDITVVINEVVKDVSYERVGTKSNMPAFLMAEKTAH